MWSYIPWQGISWSYHTFHQPQKRQTWEIPMMTLEGSVKATGGQNEHDVLRYWLYDEAFVSDLQPVYNAVSPMTRNINPKTKSRDGNVFFL